MTSNTKLIAHQKLIWKTLRAYALGQGRTIANNGRTTMVYQGKGHCVEFSIAVASPDEAKFRIKVGEYIALRRFADGERVAMQADNFYDMFVMMDMENQE